MENLVNPDFWRGRRVLVTGHTGFKGAWLCQWLTLLEARVTGYATPPPTEPSMFALLGLAATIDHREGDLADLPRLEAAYREARPDVVFHLAAQSLVRQGYADPAGTFLTNVQGTVHLLETIRRADRPVAVVVVTSDKCYENREWVWPYRETDRLGGCDPYAASKACAELVASTYARSFLDASGTMLATVRSGNVVGPGDFARDRLVPDCLRAFDQGRPVSLRHPRAVRPWQNVLDPLAGYLLLAERLAQRGRDFTGAWNFGPSPQDTLEVGRVAELLAGCWGPQARVIHEADQDTPHEAGLLTLDASKARYRLGWRPRHDLESTLAATVAWHKAVPHGREALADQCRRLLLAPNPVPQS